MKLKNLTITCLLFILLLMLPACQQSKEKEIISLTSYNALVALNDLSVDISELLGFIEKREYIESDKVILKIHETWDQLYPYVYVAGLKQDKAQAFSKDLNKVSDIIFTYSNEEKHSKSSMEAKKAELYLNSITGKTEIINAGQSADEKQPSESETDESSKKQNKDNNDMEMMDKNKVAYQKSNVSEGHIYQPLKSIILPEEVLVTTYPEIAFNEKDAAAYIAAVQLTKHLSYFYDIISESQNGKLILMKYLVQDMKASAFLYDWQRFNEDEKVLMELWDEMRLINGKEVDDIVIKLNMNIQEIQELSETDNQELIKVKCSIAIKNIEDLMNK